MRDTSPNRRQVLAGCAGMAALPAWHEVAWCQAAQARAPGIDLRRGINLWPWFSLTRELPAPSRDYDWPPLQPSRAVPRRQDLARLRDAGIDFVRIPVDPGPLIAFGGERRAALIGDVAKAVALAHEAGLAAVVNLHPNQATHYWTPMRMASGPAADEAGRLLDLIGRLAAALARFKNGRVALEPMNEPPGGCRSRDWFELQGLILRRARAAAPELPLVVTGGCGSMIDGLEALDPTSLDGDDTIFTFHFYEPYVFSHQGATWMTGEPMYRYLNSVPWPSSEGSLAQTLAAVDKRMAADTTTPASEKRQIRGTIERVLKQYFDARPARPFIERHLDRVAAWADRHAIPRRRVLMGEFGALRTDARYVAARAADRARYVRDVREAAEERQFGWAFWNYFDSMGIVDGDATRRLDPRIAAALGLRS